MWRSNEKRLFRCRWCGECWDSIQQRGDECDTCVFPVPIYYSLGCNFPMLFHHSSASSAYVMWIQGKGRLARGWLVQVSWCLVWSGGRAPRMITPLSQLQGVLLVRTLTSVTGLFIGVAFRVITIQGQRIGSISYSGFCTLSCHTGKMDLDLPVLLF